MSYLLPQSKQGYNSKLYPLQSQGSTEFTTPFGSGVSLAAITLKALASNSRHNQ